ncbi:MAG TPA: type VI secretion system baseplate subunit TssF [Pyrinomonadaceae bacterium]|nr:type VI secretion system baseplate subunit TssF [Pyrinomonadaceae bacterium]
MREDLLGYYDRELTFLRQMGAEFAQKYPKIAGRLLLEADKCEDPHVERMIEAFAFLAGRVRLKIDDDFPEITESFLNVLYPHYLAPIPSMTIVQFSAKQGILTTGYNIARGTNLYSRPIKETPCRFRIGYPVTLWPIEVKSATLQSLDPVDTKGKWREAVLKIKLECSNDTSLTTLKTGETQQPIERLRFYLNGEPQLIFPLYEFLFNNATRVEIRASPIAVSPKRTQDLRGLKVPPIILPPTVLKQVGFEPEESLLQYKARSFAGYALLSEYFAFPDKFLFFDVTGLDQAVQAGFGKRFEIHIYFKDVQPPHGTVSAETFQLGCAPAINLFKEMAEPIRLTGKQHEHHLIPDVRRQMALEVYSVDSVTADDPQLGKSREFQPFYSFRHAYERETDKTFWYASRRPSLRPEDPGTEVYLTLVDLEFNPHAPATSFLTVNTTCTNRDLPARLPFGGKEGSLEVEGAAPVSRVSCLTKPTPTLRPPLRRGAQWRLISHLTLNHLSLVEKGSDGAPDALQEILFLYDLTGSAAARKQVLGINRVASRPAVRHMGSRIGSGFVRGIETTIELDEEQYVGSGLFLFASVLEKFLGLYASINSFNQLVVKTRQAEGILKKWPPRAGQQIVL